MTTQHIFSIVFFCQIVLISVYLPRVILSRMTQVMVSYPPSTHPRLYPRELSYYERKQRTFKWLSLAVAMIGFGLLIGLQVYESTWDFDDFGDAVAFSYYLLQAIPFIWLDMSLRSELKMMRALNTRSTRTAELNPRRLFDVISPALLGAVVVVYLSLWGFVAWFNQFDYPWFGGYANAWILTGMNVFFAAIVYWRARGRKMNPHQSHAERMRRVRTTARMLGFMSIALTVYIVITVLLSASTLQDLQPTVKSIYFMLLALLTMNEYRIDATNFDVYRESPNPASSSASNIRATVI